MYVTFDLLILEKQASFENLLFMLPRQPIKLRESDKSYNSGELFNKHLCKNKSLLSPMRQ